MSQHDGVFDETTGLASFFFRPSEPETGVARRTAKRQGSGAALRTEASPGHAPTCRPGDIVDRLLESAAPRRAAGERTYARGAGVEPGWRPSRPGPAIERTRAPLPTTPGAVAAPRAPIMAGRPGLLGWLDSLAAPTSRTLSTPRGIVLLFGTLVVLTMLAFATSTVAISQLRETLGTIGQHDEPAIGAAENLRIALGAMDVDAANDSLLNDPTTVGTSRSFAADVADQITAMVKAGSDGRSGDTTAGPRIQTMLYDLQLYYAALGEAREAGHGQPWLAAQRVKFASRLLRSRVMAQADAFESSNWNQLETASSQSQQQSLTFAVSYIGIGALLTATLIGAQFFLLRRTRRLINVPLAIATGVLVLAILGVGLSIRQERADVDMAKADAQTRLVALRQAKAAGYAINADQALWMIDHEANRTDHTQDFDRRARLILAVDPTDQAGLAQLHAQYSADPAAPRPILAGLLGNAFASIAADDPAREPTGDAIASFLSFLRIDTTLRALEEQGDYRGALELRTGTKPGQGLFAFGQMDTALDAAISVADASFERRLSSAAAIASWLELLSVAVLGLSLLLATAGLWQRYQEYR